MWGPKPGRKHIWHRHTVRLVVGAPIHLTDWAGVTNADAYRIVTERIMIGITELAEQARGARFEDEDEPLTA
jgi:hypothetical protein